MSCHVMSCRIIWRDVVNSESSQSMLQNTFQNTLLSGKPVKSCPSDCLRRAESVLHHIKFLRIGIYGVIRIGSLSVYLIIGGPAFFCRLPDDTLLYEQFYHHSIYSLRCVDWSRAVKEWKFVSSFCDQSTIFSRNLIRIRTLPAHDLACVVSRGVIVSPHDSASLLSTS